jgi:hypothetical protein
MKPLVAPIFALGTLFAAAAAAAAPPHLVSVGHTDRHPTATWALPPGVEARLVEVATAETQASDGHFFTEHTVIRSNVEPTLTSWVYRSQLDPGTYYVHVAGLDRNCDACPRREWSNVVTLTIPGAAESGSAADDRPSVRDGRLTLLSRSERPAWRVRLQVCDDGASAVRLFVRQNGSTTRHALGRVTGCERITRTFRAPSSFNGGRLRVGVWARDSAGASASEAITREWSL